MDCLVHTPGYLHIHILLETTALINSLISVYTYMYTHLHTYTHKSTHIYVSVNVATTQFLFFYILFFYREIMTYSNSYLFVICMGYTDPQNADKPTSHWDYSLQTSMRDLTGIEIRKQHNWNKSTQLFI